VNDQAGGGVWGEAFKVALKKRTEEKGKEGDYIN